MEAAARRARLEALGGESDPARRRMLALEATPEVDRAFADLGFAKSGRFWIREVPADSREAGRPGRRGAR